jgi:hypothetical protein
VRDRDYFEVIYLADREATKAERLKYRSKTGSTICPEACVSYADDLKGFIRYMRCSVKSPSIKDTPHKGLQAFRHAALDNYVESTEVLKGSGT